MLLDTSLDMRADANGKDPDSSSPNLREYHQLLWSKPLPNGTRFTLSETPADAYLYHHSDVGEFWLASDSIIHTYTGWLAMRPIIDQLSDGSVEEFLHIASTIGAFILWPGIKIDNKPTINGARGFHPRIADRMDLTLECIRRHYLGQDNHLAAALKRYNNFFELFESFEGYVDFWLLQDLVTNDYSAVRFFMPFDNFNAPHTPQDAETYKQYRELSVEFVEARNERMNQQVARENNS